MKQSQVAIQLFTLREFCKTSADFAVTIKKVRQIGYTAVQVSGVGPIPTSEIAAICQAEGITICATHEPSASILDDTDAVIARLHTLGTRLTAYPFPLGVDFDDAAQISALIRKLESTGAKLREAGLQLGYHNHAHEFYRPAGGKTFLERVYDETSPENLVAELDTYWIQRGGGDVVEWVKRVKGRTPFIHLKDYKVSPKGEPALCEIGSGTLNFKRIIAEAEAGGCDWFIVEQDFCPGDPFDSIRQSFDYIKTNLVG